MLESSAQRFWDREGLEHVRHRQFASVFDYHLRGKNFAVDCFVCLKYVQGATTSMCVHKVFTQAVLSCNT